MGSNAANSGRPVPLVDIFWSYLLSGALVFWRPRTTFESAAAQALRPRSVVAVYFLIALAAVTVLAVHFLLYNLYVPNGPGGGIGDDMFSQHMNWLISNMFRVYSVPLRLAVPWIALSGVMLILAARLAGSPRSPREVASAWLVLPAVALLAWIVSDILAFIYEIHVALTMANMPRRYVDLPDVSTRGLWLIQARAIVLLLCPIILTALSFPLMRWGAALRWQRASVAATAAAVIHIGIVVVFYEPLSQWMVAMYRS